MVLKDLKPLITSKHWPLMEEFLLELVEKEKVTLVRTKEVDDLRIIQGKVRAYERILDIPEQLRYIK